jgi:ATP-dependent DNA helicase RecQ
VTEDRPYALGSRVSHAEFGDGSVAYYEGDQVVVLFDAVGYKTLSAPVVAERELLVPLARASA